MLGLQRAFGAASSYVFPFLTLVSELLILVSFWGPASSRAPVPGNSSLSVLGSHGTHPLLQHLMEIRGDKNPSFCKRLAFATLRPGGASTHGIGPEIGERFGQSEGDVLSTGSHWRILGNAHVSLLAFLPPGLWRTQSSWKCDGQGGCSTRWAAGPPRGCFFSASFWVPEGEAQNVLCRVVRKRVWAVGGIHISLAFVSKLLKKTCSITWET